MKIYTKTGDQGQTSLFSGLRVSKDHPLIEAYGTVDELNSVLGVLCSSSQIPNNSWIKSLQNDLFTLGADLATPFLEKKTIERIGLSHIETYEQCIDDMDKQLPKLTCFILPGGTHEAGFAHLARTICRRAERLCWPLHESKTINPNIPVFLNRLSDFLFVYARYVNHHNNVQDIEWKKT